ncbi:MAG TPA: M23 family metallopeptidase [Chitinophagaceae bacterium]|nr:M23 family metallopeptidase [Chitinophagaceae bacterium]
MAHSNKQAGHKPSAKLRLKKRLKRAILIAVCILIAGYLLPEHFVLPVAGMNDRSFHHKSFWYYPWGTSVRHKGVDIFAVKGTKVRTSTSGIVLYCGEHKRGGNMVLVLGPKWRIHRYLHLDTIMARPYSFIRHGQTIGKVGNSGNAKGKPSHLHYAISTPVPYVWQANTGIQGWKKIWYIDPTPYLQHTTS